MVFAVSLTVFRYKSGGRRMLRMSMGIGYVSGHPFDTNMMVYFVETKHCVGLFIKKIP